jgi:cytochrome P450
VGVATILREAGEIVSVSMSRDAIIEERPVPPKGRLAFPMLMLRILGNPVASWGEDFYQESVVAYRWLGVETAFVMDPDVIQTILLDTSGSYSKQPLNDEVLGAAIGGGLLSAEGENWRWQRRLTAPMFRAEDMLGFVPAFAAAAAPMLERWAGAKPGALQEIDRDMTRVTFQALQDTVLGASIGEDDRSFIEDASAKFLVHSIWKVALSSLRLPPWLPHPGARSMARDGQTMRGVAARVLAKARASSADGNDLLQRLINARDPATGEAMPDGLVIDNLVTFLVAGHETTSQALTWSLYLLALFPEWQERVREEVLRVVGKGARVSREDIGKLSLLDAVFQEAMRLYSPVPILMRLTTRPVTIGGVSLKQSAMIIVPILSFIVTASSGRIRSSSIPRASPPEQRPAGAVAPICHSERDPGPASAAPSPWSRARRSWLRSSPMRSSSFRREKSPCPLPASRCAPRMASSSK